MDMIGHDLKYVHVYTRVPRIQLGDDGMHHHTGFVQHHFPATDTTKPCQTMLRDDRYEISTGSRAVIVSQPID